MILAVDKGYGLDKYAYRANDGNIVFGVQSSAVAEAPMDAEDVPVFEGKKYYLGEDALMMNSETIKNMIDYKEMETFAPLSIWSICQTLKENGINESISHLSIGISLAQKEYAKNFLARVSRFKVNGDVFDFKNRVFLVPQGVGAKYAIDHFFYEENHKENYGIIDIGQLTIDVVTVVRGKVRQENASGEAYEGIIKIINELREFISKSFGNEIISIKETQEALRKGYIILYGKKIDLQEKIKELKNEYSAYLARSLKKRYSNIFKKFSKIFFVGGGAYYLDQQTLEDNGIFLDTIEVPENAEFYNAIGNLILAEKKLNEQK